MHSNCITLAALPMMCVLSGCIVWDAGYTENKPVANFGVACADRCPVTYSVSLEFGWNDFIAAPDLQGLSKKIESALYNTGLFSSVAYGEKGGEDSYHVEFAFKQAGLRDENTAGWAFLCGYSLLTIPFVETATFDGTATLSIKGNDIYSVVKAEELRQLVWLPMVPFGLFFNIWSAWHYVETGEVNALVNDIADFHRQRFLKDVDVQIMKN